ncbi:glutathione S-transferase [Octadecabacter ascidiaceicola]|uniref:Glutathione S-transferase YfcF n=1 Tax=Octadecabacter ascidiaceicola TaxID=1655543 RepID=A0A238K8F1_9RHOB|nr:glutathione S-transferase [Octadecabacter ascidiaceicola]SMX39073.1 Glutathione S-transferase YfcF [Octadecabacter ascidiaceicola]
MTYQLILGNRLYFSWSIAANMMVEKFGLSEHFDIQIVLPKEEADVARFLKDIPPARTLPTMVTPDGIVVSDSLAIAEELASRFPEANMWPTDPAARALARTVAAEMHSSFGGLRGNWPVNLRHVFTGAVAPPEIEKELDRLETIWANAREKSDSTTPWLCGDYCIADAIFAPMAARLAAYKFDTRPVTKAYVAAHLADPAFQKWRADGLQNDPVMPKFDLDLPTEPWPV